MEKRVFLAIALSFAVIGLYPIVLEQMYPGYSSRDAQRQTERKQAPPEAASGAPGTVELKDPRSDSETLLPSADKSVETAELELLFNSRGGLLRQADLKKFADPKTKHPLKLFSLGTTDGAPFSVELEGSGFTGVPIDFAMDGDDRQLSMRGEWEGSGLVLTKTFVPGDRPYSASLKLKFENTSSKETRFAYRLAAGNSFPARNSIDDQYIEANFYAVRDGKPTLRHINEKGAGKTVRSQTPVDWIAVKDRQFSIIVKPESLRFEGLTVGLGDHRLRAWLLSPAFALAPGESIEHDFLCYIGPNDIELLAPVGLDPIVNFGKLDSIAKVLVGGLELLHKVFNNYGLAIIALTFLINLLLFPMTRTSYLSMKRMQLIQPQMAKLREQHKKNPEKLNKEMMELYKKYKVNPFGGCLPMFLQMPVFIALYVALSKSVILINAEFLWINDLSSPDKVGLPFTLPFLGDQVHVLPLVMVAAMVLQQKFTQVKMTGQDPAMEAQQRMMAFMMPIFFGFIFYTMPSGLVLYWLTNTVLMALYQLRIKNMTLES